MVQITFPEASHSSQPAHDFFYNSLSAYNLLLVTIHLYVQCTYMIHPLISDTQKIIEDREVLKKICPDNNK